MAEQYYIHNTVEIGLDHPVRILHVTDAHLVAADDRDNELKRELAERRHRSFVDRMGEKYETHYFDALRWGKENCDVIVDTGDIIDFTSEALFDKAREAIRCGGPHMVCAVGNHEFSQYVGEAREDFAYKMQSYSRVQNAWPDNIDFSSRVMNGVNFVTLDNVYYDFTEKQYLLLQAEASRPYPIVLCMHTPIYHKGYLDAIQGENKTIPGYMIGAPASVTSRYAGDRGEQQFTSEITDRVVDYILHGPSIKLILAGHTHENYECEFPGGLRQLVTDMAGRAARVITLI